MTDFFPSKLLLFGEHTVVLGGQALAVPFSHFGGCWKQASQNVENLQFDLPFFINYLEKLAQKQEIPTFGHQKFREDLAAGWYFNSTIPTGYGAGSSGALVASIFARYFEQKNSTDLAALKAIFGKMESFFHGSSSGIDPLICHVQQPLWMQSKTQLTTVEINPSSLPHQQLFLLDTGIPRKTGPLVELFLRHCEKKSYQTILEQELIPATNESIRAFRAGNSEKLWDTFGQISAFQLEYLDYLIPPHLKPVWEDGLAGKNYRLKLCGAGGGGYLLGISAAIQETQNLLSNQNLLKVER